MAVLFVLLLSLIIRTEATDNTRIVFPEDHTKREEATCVLKSGLTGRCRLLSQCQLTPGSERNDDLITCGWEGRRPLICCAMTNQNHPLGREFKATTRRPSSHIRRTPTTKLNIRVTRRHGISNEETKRNRFPGPFPDNKRITTTKRPQLLPDIQQCGRRRKGLQSLNNKHFVEAEGHRLIVGGRKTAEAQWPWMVALFSRIKHENENQETFLCGGVLVSERHIISAAHCFHNRNTLSKIIARLGIYNLNQSPSDRTIEVEEVILHPGFRHPALYNDICVLRLVSAVHFSWNVQPVCLPSNSRIINSLKTPTVIGWGTTDFGASSSSILREIRVPIVSNEDCQKAYQDLTSINNTFPHGISENVLCAGNAQAPSDACQGDSGGPLTASEGDQWTLLGIVSTGFKCGVPGFPGIYTRVSSFLQWIFEAMSNNWMKINEIVQCDLTTILFTILKSG